MRVSSAWWLFSLAASHVVVGVSQHAFTLEDDKSRFTLENFIELPRPGVGVANAAGDLAFIPVTEYSFRQRSNAKSIVLTTLDATGPESLSLELNGTVFWLDNRTLAHAVVEGDVLELFALKINQIDTLSVKSPQLIAKFPTATASKFQYSNGHLVFADLVYPDGNISAVRDHDAAWANRGTTAMVFNDAPVRLWDAWKGPKSYSIFCAELVQSQNGTWILSEQFDNLLQGTGHVSNNFHLVEDHIVYTTEPQKQFDRTSQASPQLFPSAHKKTDCQIYAIDLASPGHSKLLSDGRHDGASALLNNQLTKVAWTENPNSATHEGNAICTIVVYDLKKDSRVAVGADWIPRPGSLKFSLDGETLYFTAEHHGKVKVFALPVPDTSSPAPDLVTLTHSGAVAAIQPLPNGHLLITKSSYTSPNDVFVISGLDTLERDLKSHPTPEFRGKIDQITYLSQAALKDKSLDGGEEFWFTGALGRRVQGWLFKPRGWSAGESAVHHWPVAMVIHGGPQNSFSDEWSTRWNPNMLSQEGYFSIWMNPTGSTGFGADFAAGIVGDWGGKPFVDMKAGFDFVLSKYPEIDPERAVSLGASYGGYSINWIQGHPEFGFNFKALVCHDGIFDTAALSLTTDIPNLFNHDFDGVAWSDKGAEGHRKNNPAGFVSKWSTPMLIIHGSRDFRIPESEGLAPFQALQQLGVPSRLVIFPDENHWVLGHENSLEWHKQVFGWLNEWVGQ
ncbi:Dipeptidyl-peptidase 5 [Mycena chlorophos]|uniref:Dipeptidyl-peptidase V n=1 Tax=Mycena chlorophos TaxID=658473 RepID=A0A8H6W2T9_MYCCL|nr:Dipeptidyl-peptidase 5 [Mycena chlorophos]